MNATRNVFGEQRIHVLMVEDDEDDAILTSSALRSVGSRRFEIRPASSLAAARMSLRTLPTDVVLLDLFLTDSRGLDSLLAIRRESVHMPIVVLTGLADEQVAIEALHHGAQDYLVKGTMSGAAIARTLRHAVERERLIQERLKADCDLRRAHAETQQLLAAISSVLIGLDAQSRVTKWNAAAEAAFGLSTADVLGRPLAECPIQWRPADVPERIRRFPDATTAERVDEASFGGVDGGERVLELTINPVKAENGDSAGLLILGKDITEQRMLAHKLQQARKLESIGQLAAGIAHEINSPIQFIGDNARFLRDSFGRLQTLLDEYDGVLESAACAVHRPELAARVRNARREADIEYLSREIPAALSQSLEGVARVASIVRAMKDFSHPGTSAKTSADVNHLLETTILVARNEWKYVADVVTDFDPQLAQIPCLPGDLSQVFLNLVINAAHAVDDATDRREDAKGTIRVATRQVEDWVEIRVADTGTGIAPDIRARIFDPFFTTKQVGRGSGQGLSIAYSVIVEKHGGSIDFETEVGRGTTFIIRLPTTGAAEPCR